MSRNVLMIDNHDSFTFNLVEALERLGATVQVVRNKIAAADALELALSTDALILISPGPGRPDDAGCCIELIGWRRARYRCSASASAIRRSFSKPAGRSFARPSRARQGIGAGP